jgi:sodium transport system permease protein
VEEEASMNVRAAAVGRVLSKELREALRDRNLVIGLVLVPLFLYPVIGFGAVQVFQIVQGISERRVTRVAVDEDVPAAITERLRERKRFEVYPVTGRDWDARAFRAARDSSDSGEIDALVVWVGADSAVVYHDGSRDRSSSARSFVHEEFGNWEREQRLAALSEFGLGEADLDLWRLEEEDTASASERGKRILASVLPMILLLMLALGSFYAALDAVVGERERGTLETILTAPLHRTEVLMGKYLYVVLASVTALVLNLASMTVFVSFVLNMLGLGERINLTIGPAAFLLILVTALLTAGFLAAVLMVIAIPSKTYREGQAVLMPFYIATLVPGTIVSASRESFHLKQAAIPLLNSVALFKSALLGEFPLLPVVVTLLVLAATTAATLLFASRVVAREDVYLEPRMNIRQLLLGKGGKS